MHNIELLGDAVGSGLTARAVEPATGLDPTGHTAEQACLNCRATLVGAYCHDCGQKGHVHRTLGAFIHDILHGVFHFEGKIWRTLPMLVWRPGQLTRRYVDGERARFVSPVALFLFTVFLMFAVISAFGGPVTIANDRNAPQERAKLDREFAENRQRMLGELAALRTERARLTPVGAATATVDNRIKAKEQELAVQQRLYDAAKAVVGGEVADTAGTSGEADNSNLVVIAGADEVNSWFDQAYKKAKKNPSLLFYKLQTNGYKFSWALIPISVPFVWLLFLHRRRYRSYRAYDHTVFVTYSITFMSLGFILLILLRTLGLSEGVLLSAMTFIPPIHMYRQLRGAYALSRFSALWRTTALVIFAMIAASLFGMLLLLLGVLG